MKVDVVVDKTAVFCQKWGHKIKFANKAIAKTACFINGAALGAKAGAGIGLAGSPLDANAGTVPRATLGVLFTKKLGDVIVYTDPKCLRCGTGFKMLG